MAEAERAEEEKHTKWIEAQKAGEEADAYAAKKLDKVEEMLHSRMEALSVKAKVNATEMHGRASEQIATNKQCSTQIRRKKPSNP